MDIYTIYRATNIVNNKVYIGFTTNWPYRITEHKYSSGYENELKRVFYKAIQKYGWDNFVWDAIYQSSDYDHTLKVMEPYFITEYRSWVGFDDCNGYNVTQGGEGANGWKHTEESKQRMSLSRKGSVPWNKGKKNTGPGNTNPRTEDQKKKLRDANLGKKQTPETIAKRSKSLQGHIVTKETCNKISKAHTGKTVSEVTKEKLRNVVRTQEQKDHLSKINLGKKVSNETRQKLSGCVVAINKQGELSRIPKDQYYAQIGPKDEWEWVFHKSREAATRKLT